MSAACSPSVDSGLECPPNRVNLRDAAGVGLESLGGLGSGDVSLLASAAEPGAVRGGLRVDDQPVDLWGDVPFEASDDLGSLFALGLSFGHVFLGGSVGTHPGGSASAIVRCWLAGCLPG